jgi:hypothetical protein
MRYLYLLVSEGGSQGTPIPVTHWSASGCVRMVLSANYGSIRERYQALDDPAGSKTQRLRLFYVTGPNMSSVIVLRRFPIKPPFENISKISPGLSTVSAALWLNSNYSICLNCIYILGMFPFKVQLFQGCRSETKPINTKSVVQHVIWYQVLLGTCYKANTNHCCCRATCLSGHIVDFTTHINRLYTIPSNVGGILQSVLNLIQRVKVLRGVPTETCIQSRATICCSLRSSIIGLSTVSETN